MQHILSRKNGDYYVDFDAMKLFFSHKTTRFTRSCKIIWSQKTLTFLITDRTLALKEVEEYLIPMYSRYLDSLKERKEAIRFAKYSGMDLDDSACRNFNPFNGSKGG